MKQSWLRRSNPERKARMRGEHTYGPYHRWISRQPCCVPVWSSCFGGVKGHHLRSVGAGGRDYGNEIPLCARHHEEIGMSEQRFEKRYQMCVEEEAGFYRGLWDSKR